MSGMILRACALALGLAAAGPALADEAAELATLSRVLSAVRADVDDAVIGDEHLLLVQSQGADADTADLYVFAGQPDEAAGKWLRTYPQVAFSGRMSGQQPTLRVADNGSVQILSEQSSVGRAPWRQVLTVALRGGRLMVAGFSYDVVDRVVGSTRSCDWNLLTGKWTVTRSGPDLDGKERPDLNQSGVQREDMTLEQWGPDGENFPAFCADAE